MNPSSRHLARDGSGELGADFGAKGIEIPLVVPLHRRPWARWLAAGLALGGVVIGAVVAAFAYDWRRTQLAELAAQRDGLRGFVASGEFTQFVRVADAQLVALNNFIAAQPAVARAALPEVDVLDQREHRLSWTFDALPLPIATAAEPGRVLAAHRALAADLARHGFRIDPTAERAARQLFIRLLSPHARAFVQRTQARGFNALPLDAAMQDEALAAFAARHGADTGRDDAVRMFALYAKIGPAMWQAIERDRAERFEAPR